MDRNDYFLWCPTCGGPSDTDHFPCDACLSGGFYLSPDGKSLSLYHKDGYFGPFYDLDQVLKQFGLTTLA
jgi:hypothetical protein